jgi:two-component system, OmpR family, sensor histidine kinase BaeS
VTLRRRLSLVLVAAAGPLIGGLVWLRAEAEHRASDRLLREFAQSRIEAVGRERCEATPGDLDHLVRPPGLPPPGRLGGAPRPRPGPFLLAPRGAASIRRAWRPMSMYAYDAAFRALDASAPTFPPELRARIQSGADGASAVERQGDERVHVIALRTRWPGGPCSFVLARGPAMPRAPRDAAFVASAIALCAGLLAAVWLSVGPVIRRIRDLADAMRQSAATRYEQPVPVQGKDEIAALAQAFNAAGAEVRAHLTTVERREQALRSFLANATHDVMIPLTVLQGHISSLRRSLDEGAAPRREDVTAAAEEAVHIGALVHNLGAVAKLEAGEGIVRRDPVDLSALVERVIERHRPLAEARAIELVFAVPPDEKVYVLGDMTLIEQAVGNVVANAVRYNAPGGHVALSLETLAGDPRRFRLSVVDDGPGATEEELGHLGERHFRGQAGRARHQDGQGLGLHIARTVAEHHGFGLCFRHGQERGLEVRLEGPLIPRTA